MHPSVIATGLVWKEGEKDQRIQESHGIRVIHQFHVKLHIVCLCQLVGCFIGWFCCRLGARWVGLLLAKETPPKATSIHPQVHIAPFSILVKNLQNALLDITTKDITRERSLPSLPDVSSFETLQN